MRTLNRINRRLIFNFAYLKYVVSKFTFALKKISAALFQTQQNLSFFKRRSRAIGKIKKIFRLPFLSSRCLLISRNIPAWINPNASFSGFISVR